MKFNYVRWKNFRSYGDYYTKVLLDDSSTKLIVGLNGAGKTTLVDALLWCIYGRSLSSMDDVINRKIGKDCEVEVNFNIGKFIYSIVRCRNHSEFNNNLLLFKDKKEVSLKNITDTQNRIIDIIQIPYHAMVASMIFSSEIYISFLRAENSKRLKVFDGVLNLKPISIYYDIVKKLRKPILDDLDKHEKKQIQANGVLDTLKKNLTNYNANVKKTLLELKEKKLELEKEKNLVEIEMSALRHIDHISEMEENEKYDQIIEHNKGIDEEIKEEENKIVDIEYLIEGLDKIKSDLEALEEIDVVSEQLKIDDYNETLRHNKDIKDRINLLNGQRKSTEEREDRILSFVGNKLKLAEEIKEMEENRDICPTCGQKIGEELSNSLLKECCSSFNKVRKQIEEEQKTLEVEEQENEKLKKQIKEALISIQEVPNEQKYTIDYLKSIESAMKKLTEKIVLAEQDIIGKDRFNNDLRERISKLKDSIIIEIPDKPEYDMGFLNSLRDKLEGFKDRLSEIENEQNIINEKAKSTYDKTYVEDINKKVIALEKAIKINVKKIESIKDDDFHHSVLQELFSNREEGIKKEIINRMISLFNEKVNFYLPLFFEVDMSIAFDRNLNELIKIENKNVNFATFSSGERTRLELAIAFSLFMLVKTFFSSTINLLIFDEILDMNLDKKGVSSVLEIIANLSKTSNVFIISHKEILKESISNCIVVKKHDNGFSEIIQQ